LSSVLDNALKAIPSSLRVPLLKQFEELLAEYRAQKWELVGLKAGKLCEIVYSIVSGHLGGSFPNAPSKPSNMVQACQQLENASQMHPRSLRIQIPRMIIAVYELRNNRAIGHVGGDVDPNHMDAEIFLRSAKWLISELVRVFAKLSIVEASNLVESTTERDIPVVWEIGGAKRILKASLPTKDKVILLAYSSPSGAKAKELCEWADYGNHSRFRSEILAALHKAAMIHFDKKEDHVSISPTGIRWVEGSGLLKI
jgi:hypothetical protein